MSSQTRAKAIREFRKLLSARPEDQDREEQRWRREAEERDEEKRADPGDHDQVPKTMIAPTVRVQEPLLNKQAPSPGLETIQAPPPDRVSVDQFSASLNSPPEFAPSTAGTSKRNLVIGAVVLVVLAGVAFLIWSLSGKSQPATSKSSSQTRGGNNPASPAGMAYVPGGTFMMGSDDGDELERPAHEVTVQPFYIDVYEVTNEDYEKFVTATSHRAPSTWQSGSFPSGAARKPVTGVTWDDANDYGKWAGKRLPTEEEWEFAARGTDGRVYPWGNYWQQGSANANGATQGLADVGSYKSASPFGAIDMVGNAWEWTAGALLPYPGGRLSAHQPSGALKVIRGGSYESTKEFATTTYRTGWPAQGAKTYAETGFRCAKVFAR